MINMIKRLFNKSDELPKQSGKKREMTNNEIWLLNRLKHDEVYTSNKGKKCYLEDGTYIEILGRYSYPDIDMTKSGYVFKKINTGEIDDLSHFHDFYSFFDRKPHEWITSLEHDMRYQYRIDSDDLSDDELQKKYFDKIPKDSLREIRLKELGL